MGYRFLSALKRQLQMVDGYHLTVANHKIIANRFGSTPQRRLVLERLDCAAIYSDVSFEANKLDHLSPWE